MSFETMMVCMFINEKTLNHEHCSKAIVEGVVIA